MDGQTTFLDEFNATAPDLSREVNVIVHQDITNVDADFYLIDPDILDVLQNRGSSRKPAAYVEYCERSGTFEIGYETSWWAARLPYSTEHQTVGFAKKIDYTKVKKIELDMWTTGGGDWRECCIVLATDPLSPSPNDYGDNTLKEWRCVYWNNDVDINNQDYITINNIQPNYRYLDKQTVVLDIESLVSDNLLNQDFYLCVRKNQSYVMFRSIKVIMSNN